MSKETQPVSLPNPKTFNVQLSDCWQALQGGTTIAVYKSLIELTGKIKTAVFLSQLLYWTRVGTDINQNDGWLYKSINQMHVETGLTKREQQRCKEYLLANGFIETKREGMNNKLYMRVVLGVLAKRLDNLHQDTNVKIQLADLQNQRSLFFRKFFSERIGYHRDLVTLTGCIHSAIMLSYMMRVAVNNAQGNEVQHGFASFKIHEWKLLLSLSYRNQLTVRNRLKKLHYIVERHFYSSRRIFTLVNGKAIVADLKKQIGQDRSITHDSIGDDSKAFEYDSSQVWASSVCRFGHVPKSGVTKRKIREEPNVKLGSVQSANKGVTKAQILNNIFNYLDNYNYKNWPPVFTVPLKVLECNVVVFDDLIFPKIMNAALRQQAFKMLKTQIHWPTQALFQDILDEISGQSKDVHSPLGLLNTLVKLANKNELVCVAAPMVQQQRKKELTIQAVLLASGQKIPVVQPARIPRREHSEIRQQAIADMYKALRKK